MNKLNVFVCENYSPEFTKVAQNQGFDDVIITPFFCMCENKRKKTDNLNLLQASIANGYDGLIFCSNYCDIIKLMPKDSSFQIRATNYCGSHIVNEELVNDIIEKGGYIIGSGWLNNWREHIENGGFDRPTARMFYQEFCRALVFFDAGIDTKVEEKLQELSQFLELPYVIIPFEIEGLSAQIIMKNY
jgi:hypothetical protein